VNQVPDELLHNYLDVDGAGAGDAGVLVPVDIALSLSSQAKALTHTDTPITNRIAVKEFFISILLYHHMNTIRQFLAVNLKSADISCALLAASVKNEYCLRQHYMNNPRGYIQRKRAKHLVVSAIG
jgi:hypothetical protein